MRSLYFIIAGLGFLFPSFLPSLYADTVTWVGGSGDWSTTANWSTGALPGAGDDVVVGPGPAITVTHSSGADTVRSVQSQQAFVLSGGALAVSTTFQASNTFTLSGGTLQSATVVATNGFSLVVQSGTLDGVTIATNSTLDVGNTVNGAQATVTNGLVLNGTLLVGNPTNYWYGGVGFAGSQSLSGNGTVVFGNANGNYNALYLAIPATTLTLSAGIIVRGQNGLLGSPQPTPWPGSYLNVSVINQGTISCDVSGGTIALDAQPIGNQGSIQGINGGIVSLTGTVTPSPGTFNGAVQVASGTTILGGTIVTLNGSALALNSGVTLNGVTVNGTLDVGNTFDEVEVTVTNGLVLDGTLLVGNPTNNSYGGVSFAGTQTLSGNGTVVFGVGWYGNNYNALFLAIAGTTLTISPGLTIRGQNGVIGDGYEWGGPQNVSVINQGTISCDVSGGTIVVEAQPIVNQGMIQGTNGGTASLSGTVTLSPGTVNGSVQLVNGATILGGTINTGTLNGSALILNSGVTLDGVTVNTNATLDVGSTVNGAQVTVTNGLVLNGTLLVGNATNSSYGAVSFAGTQTLSGNGTVVFGTLYYGNNYNALLLANAGTTLTIGPGITIRGQNGTIGYSSAWGGPQNVSVINQGTISCDVSGGTIGIDAQPFVNQGTVTNTLGSVSITGTVDITGQTVLLDTNTWPFNYLSYGGTVRGGQIITTNGASLVISGQLALDGVSFTGTIDVGNTYNGATLILTNGLTLNGNLLIGNPSNSWYGTVDIAGSQALTGSATVTFGNASSCNNSLQMLYAGTALTIGSGIMIHGQNGEIGYSACYGNFTNTVLLNQGSIVADVSGGSIYLGAPGGFTNTGSIVVNSNCSLYLGGAFNAASLGTLTSSNGGTVAISGIFENTNAIFNPTNYGGSWLLAGGTIQGGTIQASNGALFAVQSGTLDGVTVSGLLDVGNSFSAATLTVTNGLTLNGTALVGNPTEGYPYSSYFGGIAFAGTQTLSGNGTVVFGNDDYYPNGYPGRNALWSSVAGTTLTIGNGITIHGQYGTVGAYTAYPYYGPSSVEIINQGNISVDVSGGIYVNATGGMSNLGTIDIASNATVYFGGTFTPANLGSLACNSAGSVWIYNGTLVNTDNILTLGNYGGTWEFYSGTLQGGTVVVSAGTALVIGTGTFDGVTVNGTLDVGNSYNGASLTVTNGLTLNGIALVGNPTNSWYGGINFAGSQTLGGSGAVVFGNDSYTGYGTPGRNALWLSVAGSTLTIGSGISINGINGTLGYSAYYGGPANVNVVNQGSLYSVNGGTLNISATLTNNGSFYSTNSSVTLGGTVTLANLGSFYATNSIVYLTGTYINTNGNLWVNGLGGSWYLQSGGYILGGVVTATNGASLIGNGGTLDGVTVNGTLDVGNSVDGADLTVTNGLVLNGTLLVGNPTNNWYGAVGFAGTQTLSGNGTVVFGDGYYWYYYYYYDDSSLNALFLANAGTTLTIGPGITIRGQNGTIGYDYVYGGPQNVSVINQGTISCDVSGGTIGIDAQPFSNQGVLNAPYGTLLFAGSNSFVANNIGVGISGPGANGQISFSGNAALASLSLNVFLTNGYLPTASNTNTFTVVTYGSLGSFLGDLTLPATGPLWQGIYGPTSFTLTTTNSVTPAVYLFAPANDAVFSDPTNVTLLAYATNSYYPITEVDFLHEGTLIGIATTSPYSIVWTNPPGAVYSLTAIAKDANGGTAVSAPVIITVLPGVSGSSYVWTGSASSDWFNPANWSPAGVPGAQDAATINSGSPTLTANVNLASLFLNGGNLYGSSSLVVGNTLDWASGSISCPVTVLTNAAMNWISSSTLYLLSAITNAGTINWYWAATSRFTITPVLVTLGASTTLREGRLMSSATQT